MFLDVLYTMSQFVGPLPETLKDYKKMTHSTFPKYVILIHSSNLAKQFVGLQFFGYEISWLAGRLQIENKL